jgi:hypothetical protein
MSSNFDLICNQKNFNQKFSTTIHDFTDDEIKEQLRYLGFKNISQDKFLQFKKGILLNSIK